ncbi:hypothetical protein AVEN_19617-1 [Araneus ventricosus]|uniref:Uncharacterized protein n=1 Tax=Araneus ventricosus TaxID=182803 RepID=A0A4Y2J2C9_ARAVE|nr:hypothetical protein AVEN_19617-1 [Araneus ventricosus]
MTTPDDRRSSHASIAQDIKIENFNVPNKKLIAFIPLTPEYYEFLMVKVYPVGMKRENKNHISVVICKIGHAFDLLPASEHYNISWTRCQWRWKVLSPLSFVTENAVDYPYYFELQ